MKDLTEKLASRPKNHAFAHCIEGRYFSTDDLAKILGVDSSTVRVRLKKARARPEAITLDSLRSSKS